MICALVLRMSRRYHQRDTLVSLQLLVDYLVSHTYCMHQPHPLNSIHMQLLADELHLNDTTNLHYNYSDNNYASVGGATRHTVVSRFVILSFCPQAELRVGGKLSADTCNTCSTRCCLGIELIDFWFQSFVTLNGIAGHSRLRDFAEEKAVHYSLLHSL